VRISRVVAAIRHFISGCEGALKTGPGLQLRPVRLYGKRPTAGYMAKDQQQKTKRPTADFDFVNLL